MSSLKRDYLLQFFLIVSKSEHLHLGYCEDTKADFETNKELREAQENYLQLCMSLIPDDVNKVLDVGCGTGEMLKRLHEKNYQATGIIPDILLAEKIREKVPADNVIISRFEYFSIADRKYDLLLFMESFGYIRNMKACLEKSLSLLDQGGYILICDFFSKDKNDIYSKNFHNIDKFRDSYVNNENLELVQHKDITANTVPSMSFVYSMVSDYFLPLLDVMVDGTNQSLTKKSPFLYRLLKLFFGKTLKEKYEKLLSRKEQFNPDYYRSACSYELFLFRKIG